MADITRELLRYAYLWYFAVSAFIYLKVLSFLIFGDVAVGLSSSMIISEILLLFFFIIGYVSLRLSVNSDKLRELSSIDEIWRLFLDLLKDSVPLLS